MGSWSGWVVLSPLSGLFWALSSSSLKAVTLIKKWRQPLTHNFAERWQYNGLAQFAQHRRTPSTYMPSYRYSILCSSGCSQGSYILGWWVGATVLQHGGGWPSAVGSTYFFVAGLYGSRCPHSLAYLLTCSHSFTSAQKKQIHRPALNSSWVIFFFAIGLLYSLVHTSSSHRRDRILSATFAGGCSSQIVSGSSRLYSHISRYGQSPSR